MLPLQPIARKARVDAFSNCATCRFHLWNSSPNHAPSVPLLRPVVAGAFDDTGSQMDGQQLHPAVELLRLSQRGLRDEGGQPKPAVGGVSPGQQAALGTYLNPFASKSRRL